MKGNKPSVTAEGIAVVRAFESAKPFTERVCYDPLARRFASPILYFLYQILAITGYTEWRGPGVQGYLVARTRYIDDYLKECLENGLEQLVILGAGYDSRAYRFDPLKQIRVFEVDHPATQKSKMTKVRQILGNEPAHVIYVPVDFTREILAERLLESGYDPRLKTLFIWEGVVYYLNSEAVDKTLKFVVNHSGKNSSIILDYTYTSVIDGTYERNEVQAMRRYKGITHEKMTYGIEQGEINSFLMQRGFHDIVDVSGDFFKKAYFQGINQNRNVTDAYSIVHATV